MHKNFYSDLLSNLRRDLKKNFDVINLKDLYLLNENPQIKRPWKLVFLLNFAISQKTRYNEQKLICEIYRNKDVFNRNIFALTKLTKTPFLYTSNNKQLVIYREDIKTKRAMEFIKEESPSKGELEKMVKLCANWLSKLHSTKLSKNKYFQISLNNRKRNLRLKRTLDFAKGHRLYKDFEINLKLLLKSLKKIDSEKLSLVHGDFQIANIFYINKDIKVFDFDTMEIGHPAQDLGKFIYQFELVMGDQAKPYIDLFLKEYSKRIKNKEFYNPGKINLFKAEMLHFYILHSLRNNLKTDFKKLLSYQRELL